MARPKVDEETAKRLKAIADQEAAALKDRLAKRTAAAGSFAAAAAELEEAQATWERVQEEATAAKGRAVADLLEAHLKPAEVAELLGIDPKELRSIRSATPSEGDDGGASAAGS